MAGQGTSSHAPALHQGRDGHRNSAAAAAGGNNVAAAQQWPVRCSPRAAGLFPVTLQQPALRAVSTHVRPAKPQHGPPLGSLPMGATDDTRKVRAFWRRLPCSVSSPPAAAAAACGIPAFEPLHYLPQLNGQPLLPVQLRAAPLYAPFTACGDQIKCTRGGRTLALFKPAGGQHAAFADDCSAHSAWTGARAWLVRAAAARFIGSSPHAEQPRQMYLRCQTGCGQAGEPKHSATAHARAAQRRHGGPDPTHT